MAIEEEFSIEIPDKDADTIHSGRFPLVNVTDKDRHFYTLDSAL